MTEVDKQFQQGKKNQGCQIKLQWKEVDKS
jgi:hypothetical protein